MAKTTISNKTIRLRTKNDIYDEGRAAVATIKPGKKIKFNGSSQLTNVSTRGQVNPRWFAMENSLGGSSTSLFGYAITDAYDTTGNSLVRFLRCVPGDRILGLLKAGESVQDGDLLVDSGDGSLEKAASAYFQNNAAASTTVTNTTAETTFSNGTATIPANTLQAGDRVRVRGSVTFPSTNSTDTAKIKLYLGSTAIFDSGALDVANADVCVFEAVLTFRTVGATGTVVGEGTVTIGTPGTSTVKAFTLAVTTIDTTAALTITAKVTWSVASTSNQAILQTMATEHVVAGTNAGGNAVGDICAVCIEDQDLSVETDDYFVKIEVM
jgi:hypothetical protein